jgi:phosphate-selective porin OprO/OprP
LQGGKFWRITPALKWHLMDYMRVELGYGYGVLERFDRRGVTHFFQGRLLTAL